MRDTLPILFVESYPQARAGQQANLLEMLELCAAAQITPTVAAPRDGVFLQDLRARGFDVLVIPQPGLLGRYGGAVYRDGLIGKAQVVLGAARYVQHVRRVIANGPWQAVYCNDLRGLLTFGLAARLAGRPTLIWDKLDKPHGLLDALQLPLASRNIIISRAVLAKYPHWQRRLFRRRITRIAAGIPVEHYDPPPPPKRERIHLALLGSISPRKGHDIALAAMARMRCPLQLSVIGDPADGQEQFARTLRAQAPQNVSWLGHRHDIPAQLANTDILIAPSRHEGMSRAAAEAMASARPVIGTQGTGIAEIVEHGTSGLLVPPDDPAALADAITALAADPARRAQMGAAGQVFARAHLDTKIQSRRILDALHQLTES